MVGRYFILLYSLFFNIAYVYCATEINELKKIKFGDSVMKVYYKYNMSDKLTAIIKDNCELEVWSSDNIKKLRIDFYSYTENKICGPMSLSQDKCRTDLKIVKVNKNKIRVTCQLDYLNDRKSGLLYANTILFKKKSIEYITKIKLLNDKTFDSSQYIIITRPKMLNVKEFKKGGGRGRKDPYVNVYYKMKNKFKKLKCNIFESFNDIRLEKNIYELNKIEYKNWENFSKYTLTAKRGVFLLGYDSSLPMYESNYILHKGLDDATKKNEQKQVQGIISLK